jgi:hypothetical protein
MLLGGRTWIEINQESDLIHIYFSDGVKYSFLTSSKACHLLQSQLHDFLTISFHNTAVLGINQKPVNFEMGGMTDDCNDFSLNINEFNTVVSLKNTEVAPAPDTATFIQKVERERWNWNVIKIFLN